MGLAEDRLTSKVGHDSGPRGLWWIAPGTCHTVRLEVQRMGTTGWMTRVAGTPRSATGRRLLALRALALCLAACGSTTAGVTGGASAGTAGGSNAGAGGG
jgi:hypothetical protein